MDENKQFNKICRICTEESEGINIFSEEGKKYNLEGKIRKYLYISVYIEDKLPKMVCCNCKKQLENVHQFATMAVKTQETLKNYLKTKPKETLIATEPEEEEEGEGEEDEEDEEEGEEEEDCEHSLLHSILTKGQSNGDSKPLSDVTEVEVRVDPMLFLCDDISNDGDQSLPMEKDVGLVPCESEEKLAIDNSKPKTEISTKPTAFTTSHHKPRNKKEMKPYQCTIANCPRGFNTEIGLQNHLWGHSSVTRKVLTSSDLNSRRSSSRNFARKSSYLDSDNQIMSDPPPDSPDEEDGLEEAPSPPSSQNNYICPMCGKNISTKGNLKVHLETHRPKGKYGCDICGRIFKTQSNLYRHKEYHGGIQYPCQVCGRVYPTNSTLRAHSITHSSLRPHKCPLCDKTFKRNQDLKFHINQHTGARPYQCPYCPKAFASSGNCFSHRKRMHPGEVERDREMADEIAL